MAITFLCIRFGLPSVAIGLVLAGLANPASGQPVVHAYRSVTDVRPRIPDEHSRPYFRETQSHRGWEIREPRFTVFADTSREDARWAAEQAAQAWQQAGKLADRWTTIHRAADFGLNSLQVAISSEPLRQRDAPLTTLSVVGIQTQVQINVASGQPGLQRQSVALREGAAFAVFHATGLDATVPPWVTAGLAAAAGRTGLPEDDLKSLVGVKSAEQFGGQQWRYSRATQDTLAYPQLNQEEAAARVGFLLKGDDARHAPAFFAALAKSEKTPDPSTATEQLFSELSNEYAAWKANPLAGQPAFEPTSGDSAELVDAEREMVVLLKLQRRLAADRTSQAEGAVRMKVVTFDREKGASIVAPLNKPTNPTSFAVFASRLTDSARPAWATIDADGSVLLSTDAKRLQSLLETRIGRYSFETSDERTVLAKQLKDGTKLRGWLEENPTDKSRPLAKFDVVKSSGR